jgi:transketolase
VATRAAFGAAVSALAARPELIVLDGEVGNSTHASEFQLSVRGYVAFAASFAAMRAMHTLTVLYPADAPSTAKLVQTMADTPGEPIRSSTVRTKSSRSAGAKSTTPAPRTPSHLSAPG